VSILCYHTCYVSSGKHVSILCYHTRYVSSGKHVSILCYHTRYVSSGKHVSILCYHTRYVSSGKQVSILCYLLTVMHMWCSSYKQRKDGGERKHMRPILRNYSGTRLQRLRPTFKLGTTDPPAGRAHRSTGRTCSVKSDKNRATELHYRKKPTRSIVHLSLPRHSMERYVTRPQCKFPTRPTASKPYIARSDCAYVIEQWCSMVHALTVLPAFSQ
jgi:hypothetical protein